MKVLEVTRTKVTLNDAVPLLREAELTGLGWLLNSQVLAYALLSPGPKPAFIVEVFIVNLLMWKLF